MNDRFRFRVWDKNKKFMIYDAESDFRYVDRFGDFLQYPEDYEIMQCTGLKDNNGNLIYEGDIVDKGTRCKWIITWFKNRFILVPDFEYKNKDKCASDRECGFKYFENNHSYADKNDEVIGNIYENNELLQERTVQN